MKFVKKIVLILVCFIVGFSSLTLASDDLDRKQKTHQHKKQNGKIEKKLFVKELSFEQQTLLFLLVEKYDSSNMEEWRQVIGEGNRLRETLLNKLKENKKLKEKIKPQDMEDLKSKIENNKDVRKSFSDAIKSKDDEKIKLMLDKILNNLKKRNIELDDKLKNT